MLTRFIAALAVAGVATPLPAQLVTGVPARQVGWMCRCGESLGDKRPVTGHVGFGGPRDSTAHSVVCGACNTKYDLADDNLRLAEAP